MNLYAISAVIDTDECKENYPLVRQSIQVKARMNDLCHWALLSIKNKCFREE